MERAMMDRVQRLIDAEATERFPQDAVPKLVLLRHGDDPVIEPGELYLEVFIGADHAAREAWWDEYGDRLEDFRVQRLPEVRGIVIAAGDPATGGHRRAGIMKMDGVSLIDPEEDELTRGLTAVDIRLGPVDLETLDALIFAGIAASRTEALRWTLARVREWPASAPPGQGAREPGEPVAQAGLDEAGLGRLQRTLGELTERFPGSGVQRVALLRHGDDPEVAPGDLLVRVSVRLAEDPDGSEPSSKTWELDNQAMIDEIVRELREQLPEPRWLEFSFGTDTGPFSFDAHTGRRPRFKMRIGGPGHDLAERDLTPVEVRLRPVDLETVDTLITAGIAASRADALGRVLARLRERPAYARLSERAQELDELRATF